MLAILKETRPFIEQALKEGKVLYDKSAKMARWWLAEAGHGLETTGILL